ncbi:hypothetical protein AVEN_231359-1 [Araneus ventricosus]|uniref:Uncharacterized protein n=1 Tax=Araneus ventricosus TaxID=182803 RepID=A0A4Y2PGH4_ARAVE|nr:hypothetical protein AVEN_107187-1 [Araneus ventricosus]GBN49315.1 hypothetical protein AVEN_231359-1 [Araneus ventricosus]
MQIPVTAHKLSLARQHFPKPKESFRITIPHVPQKGSSYIQKFRVNSPNGTAKRELLEKWSKIPGPKPLPPLVKDTKSDFRRKAKDPEKKTRAPCCCPGGEWRRYANEHRQHVLDFEGEIGNNVFPRGSRSRR